MDEGRRADRVPQAGRQGLPDRQQAPRAGRPPLRRRPVRLGHRRRGLEPRPGRQPVEDRRDFSAGRPDRPGPRREARGRGGDLLGRDALVAEDGRPPGAGRRAGDRRLPGRHGPHPALHPGRERPRGPASSPTRSTGPIRRDLDAALRTLTTALRPWTIDFHVAQNDATVFGSGSHDHTGRHCLATDPTASSTSPTTPASGSATRTGSSPRRSSIFAGTAACSRMP